MKKYGKVAIAGLSVFAATLALSYCEENSDNSDQTLALLALAAGSQSSGVSGSATALSGASSSSAAATGTASAISTSGAGSFSMLLDRSNETMLAALVKEYENAADAPRAIPTTLTCQDGTCNYGSEETVSGSVTLGTGTATFNNVKMTLTRDASTGVFTIAINGGITYANATVAGPDFTQYPTLAYTTYIISGTITANSTSTIQVQTSSGSSSATSSSNGTYSSENFQVSGGAATAFSLTDTSSFSTVLTQSSGSSFSYRIEGTYRIGGTYGGEAFNINQAVNTTLTCTVSGSSVNCTNT